MSTTEQRRLPLRVAVPLIIAGAFAGWFLLVLGVPLGAEWMSGHLTRPGWNDVVAGAMAGADAR